MAKDPLFRKYHQNELTFRTLYAFTENFILPLSHDEVAHGKGSLLSRMPGNDEQKLAGLRLLFGYMYAQPGKKLLFMGGEFGQWREWDHEQSLDWHLLDYPPHANLQKWVADLNRLYRTEKALSDLDFDPAGFSWIDANDMEHSIFSLMRRGNKRDEVILVVFNFTPVPQFNYRIGVPYEGEWVEILNSDAKEYGGSGYGNLGHAIADPQSFHGQPFSLNLTLPPLGVLFFKHI